MIPRIIHYVWLGGKAIPANLQSYIDGWHRLMPCVGDRERESESERERQWIYMKWDERTMTETLGEDWLQQMPLYVQQAYAAKKFAFVSDYIRLWALDRYGGVYFDTDVEVLRPFDELPEFTHLCQTPLCNSFIGFEESKAKTLGTNVIGCEPHCPWVKEMLEYYGTATFVKEDGSLDMTPNSELIARLMESKGLVRNGKEQVVAGLHVYDFHHFSPITSTRVMRKNKDTFSIHHFAGSWVSGQKNHWYDHPLCREIINALIQVKRLFEK